MTDIQLVLFVMGIIVIAVIFYLGVCSIERTEAEIWKEISEIEDRKLRRKIIKRISK